MTGAVAAGFFDGLHPGHLAILRGAEKVVTFLNHPATVLSPAAAPRLLMPPEEKVAAIRALGVREVVALDFTEELAAMEPEEFAEHYFRGARCVRCGADWRFGRAARGDAALLRSLGYVVETPAWTEWDGAPVSSTRIRAALAVGDVVVAAAMLGHPWCATGEVRRGKGQGSALGFPTVNAVLPPFLAEIPDGVYAVSCEGLKAVANWGRAPTFGNAAWPCNVLELHFESPPPDFAEGARLRVAFLRFIRRERMFPSRDALAAQIAEDCKAAFGGGPEG